MKSFKRSDVIYEEDESEPQKSAGEMSISEKQDFLLRKLSQFYPKEQIVRQSLVVQKSENGTPMEFLLDAITSKTERNLSERRVQSPNTISPFMLPPLTTTEPNTNDSIPKQQVSVGVQVDENLLAIDVLDDIYAGLKEELQLSRFKASLNNRESMKESIWKEYQSLLPRIIEIQGQASEKLDQERQQCNSDIETSIAEIRNQHEEYNESILKEHESSLKRNLEMKEKMLKSVKERCRKYEEEYEIYVMRVAKMTNLIVKNNLAIESEVLMEEVKLAASITAKYSKEISELTDQINKLKIRNTMGKLSKDKPMMPQVEATETIEKKEIFVETKIEVPPPPEEVKIDPILVHTDPRVLNAIKKNHVALEAIRENRQKISNKWYHKLI